VTFSTLLTIFSDALYRDKRYVTYMSHIEMEELTIRHWKADRYGVNTGEACAVRAVDCDHALVVELLVATYRTFRQIESVEIDDMSPEALDAFTSVSPVRASRLNLVFLPATAAPAACNPEPQPVSYVLCRIEDDSSLTSVSQHEDISAGVVAGKYRVEVGGPRLRLRYVCRMRWGGEFRRRTNRLSGVGTQQRKAGRHSQPGLSLRSRRRLAYGVAYYLAD
jgi:hypothetical protein